MRLLEGFLNTVDLKLAWIRSWVHIAEFQRRISLYLILLLEAVNSETVPRAAKEGSQEGKVMTGFAWKSRLCPILLSSWFLQRISLDKFVDYLQHEK